MKTMVNVTLTAETQVEIEVEHEEGDDPTDLTPADVQRAIRQADTSPVWEVDCVDEA